MCRGDAKADTAPSADSQRPENHKQGTNWQYRKLFVKNHTVNASKKAYYGDTNKLFGWGSVKQKPF